MKFRQKAVVVEAVRYGDRETGAWDEEAIDRIARFMLDLGWDDELLPADVREVISPMSPWLPPEHSSIEIWDGVAHTTWLPMRLGDWLVRGSKRELYPVSHAVFIETFEPVD